MLRIMIIWEPLNVMPRKCSTKNQSAGIPLTHKVLKTALDEKLGLNQKISDIDLLKFTEQFIEESKATRGFNTIKGYKTTQAHLKEFVRTYWHQCRI